MSYPARIGSQHVNLPLVALGPQRAIALLMSIDCGVSFLERAGLDLAEAVRDRRPDIVVAPATLGIPVAIELSRALGLNDYLILQKTPKIHLGDALSAPLRSITTDSEQRLLLDRARLPAVAGRRVLLADDVISSGSSIVAALRLLRSAGADVVGIGALLTEASGWRTTLGEDAALVHALGAIPVFDRVGGEWTESWQ